MSAGTVAKMVYDLRQQIDGGRLEPHAQLPSTRALMETYGLSDNAVYRAVALLKSDGYVYSRQGRGVFVADRRALIAGAERIGGITRPGERIEWRHSIRTEAPDWVAGYIGEGECVERARVVRRGPMIREASRSWVHRDVAAVVPELDEPAPCNPTWQAIYRERSGNAVENTSRAADARIATADDVAALELPDSAYAVLIVRNVYASAGRVIGVGEIVCAPGSPVELKSSHPS
jgi:DNA-binding GntR family transcriptional regulator